MILHAIATLHQFFWLSVILTSWALGNINVFQLLVFILANWFVHLLYVRLGYLFWIEMANGIATSVHHSQK